MKDDIDRLMMGVAEAYTPGTGPKGDLYSQTVTYYGNRYTVTVSTATSGKQRRLTAGDIGFLGEIKARLGMVPSTMFTVLGVEFEVIGDEEVYGGEVLTDPYHTAFLLDGEEAFDDIEEAREYQQYDELRGLIDAMIERAHMEAMFRR